MSDFSTALVEDERLQLTPAVEFAVYKGPATIAPTTYPATGQPSSTSHQYMVTVPSLENVVDRCIIWECEFTITFSPTADLTAGEYCLDFNGLDSLAPFPLQQLITTMNCQINSTQVNINLQDMLPGLLYMVGRDELIKWNNMTPTYLDTYARYQDAVKTGAIAAGGDIPANFTGGAVVGPNINNPLGLYGSGVCPDYVPRGSWYYKNVVNPAATGAVARPSASVTVVVREPLLLSPLLFGLDGVGLQGVNQINFQINLDPTGKRVWRRSTTKADGTVRYAGFAAGVDPIAISNISFTSNSCQMYVNFLTPSPYQLAKFSPRNVVDYYQLDRYITNVPSMAVGETRLVTTQSVQLSSIPDKLIFFINETFSNQSVNKPERFMTISNVSVQFNSKQNILAQASQQLLHRYCVEAGSQQTWQEFSGKVNIGSGTVAAAGADPASQLPYSVGTTGSILVLDFGKHIDIPEMYLSSGSAGQFNLQLKVTVTNNWGETAATSELQGVLILMNSGVFSSEKGQSQVFTSLLNKDAVMSVLDEKPSTNSELKRLIGGSWMSSLMRVGKALAPVAKDLLRESGNKYARAGADVMGALGLGRSAGGVSGGGRSAGAYGLKAHLM